MSEEAVRASGASPRALSEWNPFDPALSVDPYEYYALLRREAPVYRDPNTGIFQVASYEHVCEALKNHEVFSNKFGMAMAKNASNPDPDLTAIQRKGWPPVDTMLTADPPEQKRFRSLVNKAFTPRRVSRLAPGVAALCDELIDAFVEEGRVELRTQFSVPLPLTIIAEQLGVPRDDLPRFKKWSDGFVAQLGLMASPESQVEAAKMILEYQQYFAAVLEDRRQNRRDDIISDVVHAEVEGERSLDTAECLSIIQQLLVAGNETTASTITEGMWFLVQHPEERAKLLANPDLLPNMVEEVLRLTSPTSTMWRVVKSDTVLGGVAIPAGSMVMLRYASANRDERVFRDPDRFDVTRANAGDHIAFGLGVHFCLGAGLARKEATIAFRKLLERLKNPRLAAGFAPPRHEPNILLHGLVDLNLEFDRD